ncbi:MAG TPA: cytochrome C oxidase subunit II [Nitrospinota bacterium]|jgi:cytochrome c oxidase subunit 2|nr:cytochrome C oxidase subunit II [Nitrospinota bacterium]
MQEIAWSITLWLTIILAVTYLYVAMKSGDAADASSVAGAAGSLRTWLFAMLAFAFVPVTLMTTADLPYGAGASTGKAQVVNVKGFQWYWEMDQEEVKAGIPVLFKVEAADVNHGFAIYDEDNVLITQTQAMPGYTNNLKVTFTKPGTYKFLCLEYCGRQHHAMEITLNVTSN